MTVRPKIIIHVGAPKCGSSTLQAALSATPTLVSNHSETLAYYGLRSGYSGWVPIRGTALNRLSRLSNTGYVSCPNFARTSDHSQIAEGLDQIYRKAKPGWTPIISQEGWYNRSDDFQKHLPHWFEISDTAPEIEVVAFVRPHIDWLNSAYWQWGVWSHKTWETWIDKSEFDFALGACLEKWAALPNVTLRLQMEGDVIDAFNTQYGVSLDRPITRNASQAPAMIGFMQRNTKFRSSPHDITAEFVFQRWCNTDGMPRPWALRPRHVAKLQQARNQDVKVLVSLLPEVKRAQATETNPRWTTMAPYYDVLAQGPSDLSNVSEMAVFYTRLCEGVKKAGAATKTRVSDLPSPPKLPATLEQWDQVTIQAFDLLIDLDEAHRFGVLREPRKRLKSAFNRLPFKS